MDRPAARPARTCWRKAISAACYAPWPSDRSRSGRRDDARERNQRADIPVSNSRRHWPPIANQAPHRHRQANSGTCRGREPPHARHTFEVLPPETRPNKIDLSGRKSWSESDDPAFAAKAADIVRLYMAWPWARLHGGDDSLGFFLEIENEGRRAVESSQCRGKASANFAHRGRFYRARSRGTLRHCGALRTRHANDESTAIEHRGR